VRWLSGEALDDALKLSYATIKEVVERYTRKR
jgi:biotin operon repressor